MTITTNNIHHPFAAKNCAYKLRPIVALLMLLSSPLMAGTAAPFAPEFTTIQAGFSSAVAVRNAGDGSDRLFVVEQGGLIKIIENGITLPTPFLDIDALTNGSGERGLLGLAFHPNYAVNGYFFINYTDLNGDTIIARYSVSPGDPDVADDTSRLKIISINQDFPNHNGGDIHFSPADGYLYIGMGDGGDGDDPCRRGQTIDPDDLPANDSNSTSCPVDNDFLIQGGNADSRALLGAMLRIDVDNPGVNVSDACGEGVNYGIPADNPFSDGNNDCGEIWAWGLRNPYRWGFDRTLGDLYIGDVGQLEREEVNYQPATSSGGENYGWVCREGFIANPSVTCTVANAVDPIIDYVSSGRCSVIGGFPYRGPESTWQGVYIYGDFCTGEIFWSVNDNGTWNQASLLSDRPGNIRSFGEDEQGNLYYVLSNSVVLISDANFVDLIFADGFE
ncbi:PQQ-dependent sugar dehydrogenase [Marinicella litoralis]|uniref:Glucose/sorbosone dehydrogenase n=1 Tax=Marinicella litoralis TaxID=644220 RepID=A0A4R6XTA2_9GAMM|nr:PQQ-dependent sugar dehydrogenase [Marinicella litoralis]TDR19598.1 glucose/sorbosone dehydrogenase [Marinicella litoralis]